MYRSLQKTSSIVPKAGLLLTIALLPCSVSAQVPGASQPVLTLDEAIQTAIHNSKPLQATAGQIALQHGVVEERRTGFNPTLNSRFNVTRYDQGTTASLGPQTVTLAEQTQREIGVTSTLPLDISGQIQMAVGQAKLEEFAICFGYNITRNELIARVKADYYTVLRSQALVEVAENDLKNAQERLHVAEAKFKVGVSAQFDVLRAQTDAASAQEALIQTRNNVSLALTQMQRTLGIMQSAPMTVEQVTFDQTDISDAETYQKEAITNRPERLQALLEIRAAELGVKLARRSSMPDLSLSTGYSYLPDAGGFSPRTNNWQMGVTLRIPLFDGGVSRAKAHQAHQSVDLARTDLKNTEEQVLLETQQAYLNLLTTRERIPVAEAALTQARESYRLAAVRFQTGVTAIPGGSPLVEITDAQAALTRAQTDLVNVRYDYLNARAALDRALGRYGYGEEPGFSKTSKLLSKLH